MHGCRSIGHLQCFLKRGHSLHAIQDSDIVGMPLHPGPDATLYLYDVRQSACSKHPLDELLSLRIFEQFPEALHGHIRWRSVFRHYGSPRSFRMTLPMT